MGQEQFVMLSQLVTKEGKHELICPLARLHLAFINSVNSSITVNYDSVYSETDIELILTLLIYTDVTC